MTAMRNGASLFFQFPIGFTPTIAHTGLFVAFYFATGVLVTGAGDGKELFAGGTLENPRQIVNGDA
jgi:hypothetical protein